MLYTLPQRNGTDLVAISLKGVPAHPLEKTRNSKHGSRSAESLSASPLPQPHMQRSRVRHRRSSSPPHPLPWPPPAARQTHFQESRRRSETRATLWELTLTESRGICTGHIVPGAHRVPRAHSPICSRDVNRSVAENVRKSGAVAGGRERALRDGSRVHGGRGFADSRAWPTSRWPRCQTERVRASSPEWDTLHVC